MVGDVLVESGDYLVYNVNAEVQFHCSIRIPQCVYCIIIEGGLVPNWRLSIKTITTTLLFTCREIANRV